MLYIVATPIGNLQDITFRAVEALKNVDLILCEDTRVSRTLCKQYGIETPLQSFHKFNESKAEDGILAELKKGKKMALISDAGTPGINDPGQQLIARCHHEEIPLTHIPGPCSPIVALSLSGLEAEKFQYIGFLSKRGGERKMALIDAFFYLGVTICLESPHRIQQTLKEIAKYHPQAEIAVVREMTKMHEECVRGKAADLLGREFRGEMVLLISGHRKMDKMENPKTFVLDLMQRYDLDRSEALKLAATLLGESKKTLYDCFISKDDL